MLEKKAISVRPFADLQFTNVTHTRTDSSRDILRNVVYIDDVMKAGYIDTLPHTCLIAYKYSHEYDVSHNKLMEVRHNCKP